MLFNSTHYLIFFPVVAWLFFAVPHRFRWSLLLIASYYFYMCWRPPYILVIIAITLIDYVAGIKIAGADNPRKKKLFLTLSVVSNLGLLFFFKYFNFFNHFFSSAFHYYGLEYNVPAVDVILPLGISFHTFQSLSYTFDVYYGKVKPERHLGLFALYVAFFPQMVAGPIERPGNLLPQFRRERFFHYEKAVCGVQLILLGLFKKVVIADRLAAYVDPVYGNPAAHTGLTLSIATVFFAFQVYCDFSGYTDMARGSARVLGYELMPNFRHPYLAASVGEFWRRWHISLSSWFRDYLYLPLGGSRVPAVRWALNILAVFALSGLWHGANATFIVWGLLHAFYIILARWSASFRERLAAAFRLRAGFWPRLLIRRVSVFVLVAFAWIFFRANSLNDALYIATHLFSGWEFSFGLLDAGKIGLSGFDQVLAMLSVLLLLIFESLREKGAVTFAKLRQYTPARRWALYYGFLFYVLVFGEFISKRFIYFQF